MPRSLREGWTSGEELETANGVTLSTSRAVMGRQSSLSLQREPQDQRKIRGGLEFFV